MNDFSSNPWSTQITCHTSVLLQSVVSIRLEMQRLKKAQHGSQQRPRLYTGLKQTTSCYKQTQIHQVWNYRVHFRTMHWLTLQWRPRTYTPLIAHKHAVLSQEPRLSLAHSRKHLALASRFSKTKTCACRRMRVKEYWKRKLVDSSRNDFKRR